MKIPKKRIKAPVRAADVVLSQAVTEGRSLWQDPFIHFLLILALGFIVYFNSINVPFIFDDNTYLINNPAIKNFDCFPNTQKVFEYAIHQDIKNNLVLRPVAYFTFAVNYALHGLDLFGYHLVNLLLHIGCGMLVYCFFGQLLNSPAMGNGEKSGSATEVGGNESYLPLFAALLFVCHPLQTQAVTYIIQRFVPLATFFYLAALVLYLEFRRASTTPSRVWAYFFSLLATVVAMESKEIAFTLPVIIALVELMFYRWNVISRLVTLAPFFLTMTIIPIKLMQLPSSFTNAKTENISGAINLVNVTGTSSWDYLMTQFGVITTYLRLLFLPIRQNLDYDYRLQQNLFTPEVLLPLVLLLGILGAGIYLLQRSEENRLYIIVAFGIFWFFITLSVESSIVPIEDLIFEHRAYLPSVGFFISLLAGVSILFTRMTGASIAHSKIATMLMLAVVAALTTTAIARNMVWQDEVTFWKDVVQKSPNKARVHRGLGAALIQHAKYVSGEKDKNLLGDMVVMRAGNEKLLDAAISSSQEAIRLEPKKAASYQLLAEAYMLRKNYDEALRSLAKAAELEPLSWIPHSMRGAIFEEQKELTRARQEYLMAIKIEPLSHVAHIRLASLYERKGEYRDAIKEFELVMRIYPDETVRKKLYYLKNR
ncbi:MAG: hypothetical protein PHF56_02905 [Desulfuromonadaceae bacterium]|nr:hypothetical protein [Desulfuromonadaceae bacterium]